jgi:hypothetical protein
MEIKQIKAHKEENLRKKKKKICFIFFFYLFIGINYLLTFFVLLFSF